MTTDKPVCRDCRWWERWWHRRLREIDRRTMLPAMLERVGSKQVAAMAFTFFTEQPGQEHWQCPCAVKEAGEFERREEP